MKKLLTIFILLIPSMLYAASAWDSGDIKKNSNCNQSLYYSIGRLCADTDDAKLYKGTGSAVEEVGGAAAATEVTKDATGTLSATEMIGGVVNNYGQTDDATIALASMVSAKSFVVITGTTVAKYWRLDPDGSELIYLDGSSCGAGKYVGVASVAAGYVLSCRSFQTGASAYSLYCSAVTGPWACEP